MNSETQPDRLFAIVNRRSGRLDGLCPGPARDGSCPQSARGALPCAGSRVVPMTGTDFNGLPFTVATDASGPRCPLAWVDE